MNSIIGIGEYSVSNREEDTITTYALSSCVGVTVYCPIRKAAGMIHIALPEPMQNYKREQRLGYYATTGLPLLLQTMKTNFGCNKEDLCIRIFGGANSIRRDDVFFVGKKNIQAIQYILSSLGLNYNLQEVGGYVSRTIELKVTTGGVKMDTQAILI